MDAPVDVTMDVNANVETRGWVMGRALTAAAGALMLLVSVIGFFLVDTLGEVRTQLATLVEVTQELREDRRATTARLDALERTARENQVRIRELEQRVWRGLEPEEAAGLDREAAARRERE